MHLRISLRDALCGTVINVPTLENTTMVPIKPIGVIKPSDTQRYFFVLQFMLVSTLTSVNLFRKHNTKIELKNFLFSIPGRGMPNPKLNGKRGDLIIDFNIRFPDTLSPTAKELIHNALPIN